MFSHNMHSSGALEAMFSHNISSSGALEVMFSYDMPSGSLREAMFSHDMPSGSLREAMFSHDMGSGSLREAMFSHNMHSSGALEVMFSYDIPARLRHSGGGSSGALEACAWKNIGSIKPYTAIFKLSNIKKAATARIHQAVAAAIVNTIIILNSLDKQTGRNGALRSAKITGQNGLLPIYQHTG